VLNCEDDGVPDHHYRKILNVRTPQHRKYSCMDFMGDTKHPLNI
jgi:hypothetical protein